MATLGEKLKDLRITQGLRQSDIVGEHLSRTMLSKIENGAATPSLSTLEYLANKFDKPISYFLDECETANYHFERKDDEAMFYELSQLFRKREFERIDTPEVLAKIKGFSDTSLFKARMLYLHQHAQLKLHKRDNAVKNLTYILNLLTHHEDYYYMSRVNFLLSASQGKEDALIYAQNALMLLEQSYIEDAILESDVKYNLVISLIELERFEEAEAMCIKCLEHNFNTHTHGTTGHCYNALSNLQEKRKDFKQALETSKKAIKYLEFVEDNKFLFAAKCNIAGIYLDLNQLYNCRETLNSASMLIHCVPKDRPYSTYHAIFSQLGMRENKIDEALEHLQEVDFSQYILFHKDFSADLTLFLSKQTDTAIFNEVVRILENNLLPLKDEEKKQPYYALLADLYAKTSQFEKAFNMLKLAKEGEN